jgi:2-acylglycerol O-acyltransferase 2
MSETALPPVEPSKPEEREAHDLAPKSYAEAAEEALEPESHDDATDGTNENQAKNLENSQANGDITEPSQPEEREARNLPPKSYADATEEALKHSHDGASDGTKASKTNHADHIQRNGRIRVPLGEGDKEQVELEGAGQDNSTKSPTRGHRRKTSSVKSNGSIGRKHGENLSNGTKQSLTSGIKLESGEDDENEAVARKKQAAPKKRRESELKSGRQAGAGWQKSKYVAPRELDQAYEQPWWGTMKTTNGVGGLVFVEVCFHLG